MIAYISGAVTGKPNNNKRAFQAAYSMIGEFKGRPHLRDMKIINPLHIAARLEKTFTARGWKPRWEDYMRACIKKLCEATCVYFLPDWTESKGATMERYIANRLGIACADNRDELQKIIGAPYENQFNG
jgi:hypothetical protein